MTPHDLDNLEQLASKWEFKVHQYPEDLRELVHALPKLLRLARKGMEAKDWALEMVGDDKKVLDMSEEGLVAFGERIGYNDAKAEIRERIKNA